jgi:aryl-alcohol dehydrogenase-like predicted oxidoreductase
MATGRIDVGQVPYNPVQREVEWTILPLAGGVGLSVLLKRLLGEGQLVRLPPSAAELAPLRPLGITTRARALIKWGLSDPRVPLCLAPTSNPVRLGEKTAAGSPPWVRARGYGRTCCAWPQRTDQPGGPRPAPAARRNPPSAHEPDDKGSK